MTARDDAELDRLIRNWQRWCFGSSGAPRLPNHATSIEGNYRSPQCWDPLPNAKAEVNELDGMRLQNAVSCLDIAAVLRKVFLTEYFPSKDREHQYFWPTQGDKWRYARVQRWNYTSYVAQARKEIWGAYVENIDRQASRRYKSPIGCGIARLAESA